VAKQPPECTVEGCTNKPRTGGLCNRHHVAAWRKRFPEKRRETDRKHRSKPENREKARRRRKEWAAANPDKVREQQRNKDPEVQRARNYKSHFGITIADYDRMLASQGGRCAICKGASPVKGKYFHVDHDHGTGAVRGLLCQPCNVAIGLLRDSPERCLSALMYLVKAAGSKPSTSPDR